MLAKEHIKISVRTAKQQQQAGNKNPHNASLSFLFCSVISWLFWYKDGFSNFIGYVYAWRSLFSALMPQLLYY